VDLLKNATRIEKVLYWTFVLTWVFYGVGALYIVGPVLGWLVFLAALIGLYLGPAAPDDLQMTGPVPISVWVWMVFIALMLIVLWVGHYNFDLGLALAIKSSVGWAKGWALLAIFLFIGAMLPIRRELLIRAQCVVGLQTLILLPLLIAAPLIGLPESIFVSPLKAVGGPGPEYFTVFLYTIDPASGAQRWQFYAPWSPFAGLLAVVMVLCALEEKVVFWKVCGLAAGIAMVLMTKSRMSLIGVVACGSAAWIIPWMARTYAWYIAASVSAIGVFIVETLMFQIQSLIDYFRGTRAGSSHVRDTLQRIAWERWWSEAQVFGHGTVEAGGPMTAYMPIGSHHTWYGLLFVKGATGFFALLVPVVYTLAEMTLFAISRVEGRLPFGLLLALIFFSLGENLEVQVYLFWPAMVLIGIGTRQWWGYQLYTVYHKQKSASR